MTSSSFKIVGLGEILWDVYEDAKYLGGAPANFAVHCQQLGNAGIIASRIGDDLLGHEMKAELQSRNLTTEFIQADSVIPTGTVNVSLDSRGKPSFQCNSNVAFDYMHMDEKFTGLAKSADAVLFGTLAQREIRTRETVHSFLNEAKRSFKIYDINIRGWDDSTRKIVEKSLQLTDAIKLNDDELAILKQAWNKKLDDMSFLIFLLNEFSLKLIALTLGANGCVLVNENDMVRIDGKKINIKDTTGCGDAFVAGLVHQYLRGKSLKETAEFSNALGAFVAQFPGATPKYSMEEFEAFLVSKKTD